MALTLKHFTEAALDKAVKALAAAHREDGDCPPLCGEVANIMYKPLMPIGQAAFACLAHDQPILALVGGQPLVDAIQWSIRKAICVCELAHQQESGGDAEDAILANLERTVGADLRMDDLDRAITALEDGRVAPVMVKALRAAFRAVEADRVAARA